MQGWISLHRKILENPIVCKDSDYFSVWCYLLLNATHKDHDNIFKGERITLQPGQLITGRKKISTQFNINESKVKRILLSLENDQQIDRQRSNKNSLITVLNWHLYQVHDQQVDQQVTNNRPASDQQVTTNNNVITKQGNKNTKAFQPPTLEQVEEYSQEKGYQMDCESFVDFYASKGWMVGRNKMKDWKAAVRNWNKRNNTQTSNRKVADF